MHSGLRRTLLVLGLIVFVATLTGCAKRPVVVDASGVPVPPASTSMTPAR